MNKFAFKIWLITKMERLEFQMKFQSIKPEVNSTSQEALKSQIQLLKDLYDDFNMDEVDITYLQGPK